MSPKMLKFVLFALAGVLGAAVETQVIPAAYVSLATFVAGFLPGLALPSPGGKK